MYLHEAMQHKDLFKTYLGPSYWGWEVAAKAIEGQGSVMDEKQLAFFQQCTKRQKPPDKPIKEFWCVSGRRSGKSYFAAILAVYLALFNDYEQYLSAGEVGTIQVISSDRQQSQVIFKYISGMLNGNENFKPYILNEFKESIELTNRVTIEVMSCSYRSIRGRTVLASICDEMCFWMTEGQKPDREILAAIRPSMMTIPNSKLIVISSPYSRTGSVYEMWENYFGKDSDSVLVWQSESLIMNPTLDKDLIDIEYKKDPSAAHSEYGAEWRSDIEGFLDPDLVKAATVIPGEMAPKPYQIYSAFTDSSGGRQDRASLAIGHYDYDLKKFVVDLVRGWDTPHDPHQVTQEVSEVCKRYRVHRITGDRYAARWVSEAFAKHGIIYSNSELSKSNLFLEFEPLINTQQVQLPKNKILFNELLNLERKTGRSGRDSVTHPPGKGASDDLANAVAGCAYLLTSLKDSAFANCDLT
jgi:hypothetical protein